MLTCPEIAHRAYMAYAVSTGGKNFRGDPMPDFGDLPQPIRTAWEAAVTEVGNCIIRGMVDLNARNQERPQNSGL